MATTCAQALKDWEAKTGLHASEAVDVKLYGQVPPISKLDNALNSLVLCQHLSLSTNCIDRLIPLNGMKALRVLSVGRNMIKKIEKLDEVAETLQELWMSYNQVSSLDGLQGLSNLTTLYISNNNIKSWSELDKIAGLANLKDVLLVGNPIYDSFSSKEEQRIEVLRHLPNLAKIDGDMVKPAERDRAQGVLEGEAD